MTAANENRWPRPGSLECDPSDLLWSLVPAEKSSLMGRSSYHRHPTPAGGVQAGLHGTVPAASAPLHGVRSKARPRKLLLSFACQDQARRQAAGVVPHDGFTRAQDLADPRVYESVAVEAPFHVRSHVAAPAQAGQMR